jgi:Amidase
MLVSSSALEKLAQLFWVITIRPFPISPCSPNTGKANLSEWAHFRSNMASGWSGRGGQASSAYYPNGEALGSSTGSAIAASIGLAAVTLGTETNGSITGPASYNNIAGIKPTVGLTSRAGGMYFPSSHKSDFEGLIIVYSLDSHTHFHKSRLGRTSD